MDTCLIDTAPMRHETPSTDDAFAVKRRPIDEDNRVPMFGGDPFKGSQNPPLHELDGLLYIASLSSRGPILMKHERGHITLSCTYRGRSISIETAWLADAIRGLAWRAAEIDEEVGLIRLKPLDRSDPFQTDRPYGHHRCSEPGCWGRP